jgi:hypothetical protein
MSMSTILIKDPCFVMHWESPTAFSPFNSFKVSVETIKEIKVSPKNPDWTLIVCEPRRDANDVIFLPSAWYETSLLKGFKINPKDKINLKD